MEPTETTDELCNQLKTSFNFLMSSAEDKEQHLSKIKEKISQFNEIINGLLLFKLK